MEKVCIVGGGAGALMCACFAKNKNITIVEKNEKVGKKILATGNGRCNLTNVNMNNYAYNINLDKFLSRFTPSKTLAFFNEIGLITYVDDEGRVYPISNTANSVLDVLKNNVQKNKNIKIITEKQVIDVNKQENLYKIDYSDGTNELFNKVVIASGNLTNLTLFDKFNIKYKKFTPSLCGLVTEKHKNLMGVRCKNVLVKCNLGSHEFNEIGEILFKDDGISGIVIFNLSSHMARIGNFNQKIVIDFMPEVSAINLVEILKQRRNNLNELKVEDYLTGIFHKAINFEILKRCGINFNKRIQEISEEEINKICHKIKCYELQSISYSDNNQVFNGGIDINELTNNLECKQHKGLYFIGEVVDVDGVCGGYNLQWAWTSGKIVGESL